jgi:phosphoglycerol transferase MdoB-like AlkP superfamily enzyme
MENIHQNRRSLNGFIDLGRFENIKYSGGSSQFSEIFAIVLIVLIFLYHGILGVLYYIRRNKQPLKSRKLSLIVMAMVFNLLFCIVLCLRNVLTRNFNCAIFNILSLGKSNFIKNSFFTT